MLPAEYNAKNLSTTDETARLSNAGLYSSGYHAFEAIVITLKDNDRKAAWSVVQTLVPTAAVWFRLCARDLHRREHEGTCTDIESHSSQ